MAINGHSGSQECLNYLPKWDILRDSSFYINYWTKLKNVIVLVKKMPVQKTAPQLIFLKPRTEAMRIFMEKLSRQGAALFAMDLLGFIKKRVYDIDEYTDLFVLRLKVFFNQG